MAARNSWSIRVIDLAGCLALLSCGFGGVWLAIVRQHHTQGETRQLTHLIRQARYDDLRLQSAMDTQRELLTRRREELAAVEARREGAMEAATERYFQMLSGQLATNSLQLIRQSAVAGTIEVAPGLHERRFVYEVTGPLAGILHFLQRIEESEFWADVSYLQLTPTGTAPSSTLSQLTSPSNRTATLTLSLFSRAQRDGGPAGAPDTRGAG